LSLASINHCAMAERKMRDRWTIVVLGDVVNGKGEREMESKD